MTENQSLLSELIESYKEPNTVQEEAEILSCRFCELVPRTDYIPSDFAIPFYEYNRPNILLWDSVYQSLRLKGFTQEEAICWLQSKNLRWTLDGLSDTLMSEAATKIAEQAHKKDLEYPLELWTPEEIEDYRAQKPDVLIYVNEGTVNVFSNNPDELGTVLLYDNDNPQEVEEFKPEIVNGDASEWKVSLSTLSFDYGDFLEKFMIANT